MGCTQPSAGILGGRPAHVFAIRRLQTSGRGFNALPSSVSSQQNKAPFTQGPAAHRMAELTEMEEKTAPVVPPKSRNTAGSPGRFSKGKECVISAVDNRIDTQKPSLHTKEVIGNRGRLAPSNRVKYHPHT